MAALLFKAKGAELEQSVGIFDFLLGKETGYFFFCQKVFASFELLNRQLAIIANRFSNFKDNRVFFFDISDKRKGDGLIAVSAGKITHVCDK